MKRWRRAAWALVGVGLVSSGSRLLAHEHTARRYQEEQARSEDAGQWEAAPRPSQGEKACRLAIGLFLADTRQPVAGLVRINRLATGKWLSFPDEIRRERGWLAIEARATLEVPPARVRIEAFHGLTTEIVVRELDLTGRESASVDISLTRFYDPGAHGLRSGNTHLHLRDLTHAEAVRYLELVPRADGLDLVFLSYLERPPEDRKYISNRFTAEDLGRLSREGVRFGNGEEHRHNFGPGGEGFGHVMFLDIRRLIEPVSLGPGITKDGTDGVPLQRGIREARADGATVVWCHNKFGHEDLPNWVGGLLHAQNIFDGGSEGTYADTFYRYLDVGMKVPFSTGTDWFIYDFARVYVPLEGEPTAKRWREALAAGRSYITNGPFLELQADGKTIGDTIQATAGQELRIVGRAIGRTDFRRVELVHDGRVVHAERASPQGGHFLAPIEHRLAVTEPGWLALRVPDDAGTSELGKPLFAHTSAVYLELAGRRRFRAEVARSLLAEMQESLERIGAQGRFGNAAEREAVLRVYRDGAAALQGRIGAVPSSPAAPGTACSGSAPRDRRSSPAGREGAPAGDPAPAPGTASSCGGP